MKGGIDSCQGDSGGPIIQIINDAPRQVGVISWGVGCGRVGYYGVYADIRNVIGWIKEAAGFMKHPLYKPAQD